MTTAVTINGHDITLEGLDVDRARRRIRSVLMIGQVLAGLGMGATLSVGAILATELSGSAAWSGSAATLVTLGAAMASFPLARLAQASGRSWSLATGAWVAALGAVVAIASTITTWFPLLLVGLLLIGTGTAVNLQARFAATDVSSDEHRATDLSLVVWATTVGAVSGPNLIGPGDALGLWMGLPMYAGPFVMTAVAQFLAGLLYRIWLRPEPLSVAKAIASAGPVLAAEDIAGSDRPRDRVTAFVSIALSHATMVAVMAMTPVHLVDHGASLVIVGFTISLHIAGMYALSPLFGLLADTVGRIQTILFGQLMLAVSLFATGFGAESEGWVIAGLILLGTGWSAATVAGSALLTESTPVESRTKVQGLSDVVMSAAGATGGALSGVVLFLVGYSGLSFVTLALVAAVVVQIMVGSRATHRSDGGSDAGLDDVSGKQGTQ